MKLYTVAVFAAGLVAAGPENRCTALFPNKMPFLTACSTARQFCTKYIHGTGSYTTTTTTFTSTITVPAVIETVTSPDPTSTVTERNTVSTDAPTNTIYSPDNDGACGRPTPTARVKRQRQQQQPRRSSCGIAKGADPTGVSGACNCYLAHTTTISAVATSSSGLTTTTEYTLDTTTTVTTVYTATPTEVICRSPRFNINVAGIRLLVTSGGTGNLYARSDIGGTYQIVGGVLNDAPSRKPLDYVKNPSIAADAYLAHSEFFGGPQPGGSPLNCYIDDFSLLQCTTPGGSRAWLCGGDAVLNFAMSKPDDDCEETGLQASRSN